MDMEAEADEANGWVRYNPETPSAPEEAANTLVVKRKITRKAEAVSEGV